MYGSIFNEMGRWGEMICDFGRLGIGLGLFSQQAFGTVNQPIRTTARDPDPAIRGIKGCSYVGIIIIVSI